MNVEKEGHEVRISRDTVFQCRKRRANGRKRRFIHSRGSDGFFPYRSAALSRERKIFRHNVLKGAGLFLIQYQGVEVVSQAFRACVKTAKSGWIKSANWTTLGRSEKQAA